MKKLLFIILIVGQFLISSAQDKVYIDADFSAVPPTGWTVRNDQGGSGTTNNWTNSSYPIVYSDVVSQNEWIKSPTISLTATYGYRLRFSYMASAINANENLYLIVSTDNGATWSTNYPVDNIWNKNAYYGGISEYWLNSGNIDLSSYAAGGDVDIKIGFVYQTDGSVTDAYFAVDNVVIEEDNGGGYATLTQYRFENGLTAASWTKTNGVGSTQHFNDFNLAKVEDDLALYQEEYLITNDIMVDDNSLTDVTVSVDWFAYYNSLNNGLYLYYSTDNGANYYYWDDISASNIYSTTTNQIIEYSTNVNNFKGQTVRFALRFVSNGAADIFVNSFVVEQVFNEGSVQPDAEISLQTYDTLLFPTPDKYNGNFAEGFWQVAPADWTLTQTNANATWFRDSGLDGHDYNAAITGDALNQNPQDETLTTNEIALSYPPVGAVNELKFQYRIDADNLLGTETTTDITGPGVTYNLADVAVQIRVQNGATWGAWQNIWTDTDNAQYITDGSWVDESIMIDEYLATNTSAVQLRFVYTSATGEAGYFSLDNISIVQTRQPEFELHAVQPFSVTADSYINYSQIPVSQLNNPYQIGAFITNNGVASFTNDRLYGIIDGQTIGYKQYNNTDVPAKTTKFLEVDTRISLFAEGVSFDVNNSYTINYTANPNGNALNKSTSFVVTPNAFSIYDGFSNGGSYTDDGVSGSLGSMFEFKRSEKLTNVQVYVGAGHTGSEFNMSIIKVASPTATTGTVVYTSPLKVIDDNSYHNFALNNFTVTPGYYIFMFNQLDEYRLNLLLDNEGTVYRGNASNIYTNQEDNGDIWMTISVVPNTAPEVVNLPQTNYTAIAGQPFELEFVATDVDGDSLRYEFFTNSPEWLTGWVVTIDSSNNRGYIKGTPTVADLGTINYGIDVTDDRGGWNSFNPITIKVISQVAAVVPNYIEEFNISDGTIPTNWSILRDQNNNGNTETWGVNSNMMVNNPNAALAQNEWIISAPVYLPKSASKALDTMYTFSFDWQLGSFDNMCKGTPVLGSGSNGNGNFADVTVWLSNDNGKTWATKLWKEDDRDLIYASTEALAAISAQSWTSGTSKFNLDQFAGDTILIAFQYESKNAKGSESFKFDAFKIETNNPVDIKMVAFAEYTQIPKRLVDVQNGHQFNLYFINKGQSVPENSYYTVSIPEIAYYEEFEFTGAIFDNGDTALVEIPFMAEPKNIDYNLSVNLYVDGAYYSNATVTTSVTETALLKNGQTASAINTTGLYDGLGTIYELNNQAVLQSVSANIGGNFTISLIRIEDRDATSGELIATTSNNSKNFGSLLLQPGLYAIMVNQTTSNPVTMYRSNNTYDFGDIIHGNQSNIYRNQYEKGDLELGLLFETNNAPYFIDANQNYMNNLTLEVLQGVETSFKLFGIDEDAIDNIYFEQVTEPAFYAPAWLSFNETTEDTVTMTIGATAPAGTHPAILRVKDGIDSSSFNISIKVVNPQLMNDELDEPVNSWTENYPTVTTSNHQWRLAKGSNSKSTNDWYNSGNHFWIDDDNDYQNEWLISPFVYFNQPTNDTTYWLSFDFNIIETLAMLGGTQGQLGSVSFDGGNYADLRVLVSTNGGNTWNLLWQEDNEQLVKAANSDIVYPYNSNNNYEAKIDITYLAGNALQFAIQYEGVEACPVYIDNFKVDRVDPFDDLQTVDVNVGTPYRMIPVKQAQDIDVRFGVTNIGTTISEGSNIGVKVDRDGFDLDPKYEVIDYMAPVAAHDTVYYEYDSLKAELLPSVNNIHTYNLSFYTDYPDYLNQSQTIKVNNQELSYADGYTNSFNHLYTDGGIGQIFEIKQADLLTRVRFRTVNPGNDVIITFVELENANSLSGEIIYNSGIISNAWYSTENGYNGHFYSFEPFVIEPGYYAVFISSAVNDNLNISYQTLNDVNPGSYIIGNADSFEVINDDKATTMALVFDNTAPMFVDVDGSSLNGLGDENAYVGVEFTKTVRANDEDDDDMPSIIDYLVPEWITVTDNGNGIATLSGTPTVDDLGEYEVTLRAVDGTTYDEESFMLFVNSNPEPKFVTNPAIYGIQGVEFTYTAIAIDDLGDAVALSVDKLPSWLTATGEGNDTIILTGTPTAENLGQNAVKLLATDAFGMSAQQIFNISVVANNAPVFISTPVVKANAGLEYNYRIFAQDANNNDELTITGTVPTWLTLTDNGNGVAILSGTPAVANAGDANITLTVTDSYGATGTQTFTIVVKANAAPVFTSTAVTSVNEDALYSYNVVATDANGDNMYFVATKLPNWLVLTVTNNGKATLKGVPTQKYVGANLVEITVGDGENTTTQAFTITVAEVNDAPEFKSTIVENAVVNQQYVYNVEVFDEEEANINITAQMPEWLTLEVTDNGTAKLTGTPIAIGEYNVVVKATDGETVNEQAFILKVANGVVSVDELSTQISLFPNPATGKFTVSNVKGAKIEVVNVAGQTIKVIDNAINDQVIDLTGNAYGSYVVRIINGETVINKQVTIIK